MYDLALRPATLPYPTPVEMAGWMPLRGAVVLLDSAGAKWKFEYPYFRNGYPVYVHRHFGKVSRLYRDGDEWLWANGSLPMYRVLHVEGGDPNLPPTGRGWVRCDNSMSASFSFKIAPDFERAFCKQGWTLQRHAMFPPEARDWVFNLLLCNNRVICRLYGGVPAGDDGSGGRVDGGAKAAAAADDEGFLEDGGQVLSAVSSPLPPLPLEMVWAVLSMMTIGDMMPSAPPPEVEEVPACYRTVSGDGATNSVGAVGGPAGGRDAEGKLGFSMKLDGMDRVLQ